MGKGSFGGLVMKDYNLDFIEDSDYKSEFFEEFEFDLEDYDITQEKEEVYNLMTLREAIGILDEWSLKIPELEKITSKTITNLTQIINEYEKLGAGF